MLDVVAVAVVWVLSSASLPLVLPIVVLVATALSGGYRLGVRPRLGSEISPLAMRVALPAVVMGSLTGTPEAAARLIGAAPALFLALLIARFVSCRLVMFLRARDRRAVGAVIVGAGRVGVSVAERLRDGPEFGLHPIGFIDDVDDTDLPLPVLGRLHQFDELVRRHGASVVIIAYGTSREAEVVSILRMCEHAEIDVYVVPRLFEMGTQGFGGRDDEVWGIPLQRLRREALKPATRRVKRAFDLVVASAMLLLLAPVLALIALLVKLTSRGPVFFRQERIGQGGRPFRVLKFRTMQPNSDEATTWTVTNDDRVTALGRILRPTSLDELPQIFNVLQGDMSLVGPRPERPHFVEQFAAEVPGYRDRHRVPVGLTGLAQVNGLRGDTSIADRAMFDNLYIERWSLAGDIAILGRTLWAVVHPPRSVMIQVGEEAPVIDLRHAEQQHVELRSLPSIATVGSMGDS